ncbi:MAG TPA: thymidine kinase [Chthonomonadaceae bacterium]|nr:thymidine kinase [Chthonomonadaceae bacterium]
MRGAEKRKPSGSITIICGSMFSGKTEELIRLVRRAMHARKQVQVFKSSLDTRCETTVIRTHDDICFNAVAVPDSRALSERLEPGVEVVGIEEVQFFDDEIVPLCQQLADRGVQVIAAGLDQDFRGLPFGFMPGLLALADNVLKLHAICKVCGAEASRTQRLVNGRPAAWDEPTILIGAEETYEARCRHCHRIANRPRAFRPLGSAIQEGSDRVTPRRTARSANAHGKNGKNGSNGAQADDLAPDPPDDGAQLQMFSEPDS